MKADSVVAEAYPLSTDVYLISSNVGLVNKNFISKAFSKS